MAIKKKKEKLDFQASINAITNAVKNPEPKKSNNTIKRNSNTGQLLNRSDNTKTMPTFSPKDNRTIKTQNTPKKKSVSTFDVYERGGKYFYEDNGKEVQIKKKYLKNAIKNNRSGVVGSFDEKGKFSETNNRGVPIKQTKEYKEKKQKQTIDTASKIIDKASNFIPGVSEYKKSKNTINNIKGAYKGYKEAKKANKGKTEQELRDEAIVNVANAIEASPQYKNLKTAGNFATNMGYGALKQGVEGTLDFAQSISDWINNSAEEKAKVALGMRTADEARREREEAERQQSEWTGKSLTDEGLKKAGWNEDLWNQWEDGSAVRRDNIAGQIAQAVGGMMPSIYAGKALGFNNTYNVPLKGLKGAELAKGIGKNVGMSLLSNAGGNAALGASAYGNAYEEAVNNGATPEQARRYGALSAGTEFATEMITGGIPGLKQTGILDNMADGLIDKATGKVTNKFLKQATAAFLKMGYTGLGEGFEEGLADIINPMIKNATYTDGERINWQDVWRDAFVGGTIGTILGGGNAAVEGIDLANQQIANQQLQELNTIADQRIQQLQQEVQQDPSRAQEATQEIEDIQRYVQAQTNTIQNQAQTQAQENETTQPNSIAQQTQNVAQNGNIRVIDNRPVSTNKEAYNSQPKEGTIRLYTNTDAKNIDSILQNGLDVNKAKQNEYEGNMTWFETRPDLKGYGGTTIAVDVPINSNMDKVNDTQYTVYDNISPENIVFVDKPVMNNYRTSDIEDLVNKYGEDKVRNVFNKALENSKASMSQQEFDNLITAIKGENDNIPSKSEQSVISEGEKTSGVFSTVAPYYSTQVNDRNYNKVKENVDSQFTNKALNIASNLGVNVEGIQNNVGGYSFDDGKGRVDELSYTYKLKDGTTKENARMFGCLLGDLGHEVQESVVVGNYTNSNNENANLEYTLKLKDGSGIIKALKEAGITDYTFNKQTNELQLLLFKDESGNFNEQEILDQFQKLNQVLGGKISEPTKNYVESELIESEDRQNLYGEWLESNRGTKNRELYNQIEEAYEKVKSFNEQKKKDRPETSSNEIAQEKEGTSDSYFSNENALAKREEGALDKDGNLVMSTFLKDNGGGGNNNGGGNNTTALGKQPQPKKGSVEADILRSYDERLRNKKKPFKEKISEDIHEATRAWFDMGEEIARIGKGHNDAMLYPLYDLSKTAKASADYSINANQTNLNGEKIGDSLNKVWEEVENKNLVYEMNKYLYELHNIDRWNQFNEDGSRKYVFGPEHSDSVSRKNIADLLRLHPELERLSKPILKYQKNLSQLLVDSGIRSKAQQDALDSIYKNYVPTWRDRDDVGINATSNYGGNVSVNNQTKTATGSTKDLLPLKEVQALMTENIFKASRTNIFLQQLYKDIGDLDALKKIGMKNLKSNTNIEPVNSEQFYSAMEDELDKYLKESAPNNVKVEKVDGQPVATLWFNGEKVSMPIDKGIQVALEPVVVEGRGAEILNAVNNIKRGLITQYNPIFAATNAIKDAADAAVNSKFSAVEYKAEYLKSFKEMLTNKKMSEEDWTLFNQYLAMGGYSNTVFDKRTGFAKPSKGAKKVVDKIGDLNDFIEQIPRFTEFKLTLKHGGTLTEAMYNAAEVTTNFKRSGVLTKKLDKLATTFFSASTAGFYKQVRNLTQQPNGKAFARFATKALALGLTPAIINSLMYANPFGDDDDKDEAKKAYKNLPQYVKDNYLVWYTGDGKFLRIPKGRVVSIPGIAYNAATNKINKEEVTFGEVAMSMLNQVGPSNPLSSNAILQIWQSGLFDNKSQGKSWSGNEIESYYLHKKPVTERYDSRTDKFSIALSKGLSKATNGKIQLSPKKLSYTLEQNSGIIGDITLPWLTPKSTGPSTASRIANPIISKFVTDTVISNKTSNKFYNEVNKYSEKKESSNATREDLVKNSYLGSVSGEIAEKRKEIEKVESSSLSKNEKYKQTRDLQKEINALQEKGLKETGTYKNISKYVSEIGDDTYYKSSYEGRTTWKKETDKTKAIIDNLGLSAKDYYYYKNEESYTPRGGNTQYITSGKNAKYNIAMVDAFNFDPSDYLKYKHELSQIRGDKDSRGKTIRYSARNKKLKYLNSLPISSVEKAYLMKQNDKYYKSSDKNLKKAISKSNLSKKEKEEMYSYLGLGR